MTPFKGVLSRAELTLLEAGSSFYDTFSGKFQGHADSSYPSYIQLPHEVRVAVDTITLDQDLHKQARVRYATVSTVGEQEAIYAVLAEAHKGRGMYITHPSNTEAFARQVLDNARATLRRPYMKAVLQKGFWSGLWAMLLCFTVAWGFHVTAIMSDLEVFYPRIGAWLGILSVLMGIVCFFYPFLAAAHNRYAVPRAFYKLGLSLAESVATSLRPGTA